MPGSAPSEPVARVLARLRGAKRSGGQWIARCPAHEDRTPSLAVSEGRDGRVLLKCHAGCSFDAIRGALGVTAADLHTESRPPAVVPLAQPRTDVRYFDYRDRAGVLRYRVKRVDTPAGNDVRPEHPNGTGGFVMGRGGVAALLYRLPELAAAVARGERVYVVEGEPKVDQLASCGLVATTSGSATSWGPNVAAAFAREFAGADVVILPDNDKPGRDYAAAVADSLRGVSRAVRVIELPGLPEHRDVVNWVAAGRTRADFERVVAAALTAADPDALPEPVCLLHAPPPEPIACVVRDLWTAGDYGLFVGDGGSGKTTAARGVAGALAGGYPVFDRFPCEARPVVIVSEEDGQSVLHNRLEALIAGRGWDRVRVLGNIHLFAHAGVRLLSPAWEAHLGAIVTRLGAGLVIYDPWRDLNDGDEDKSNDAKSALAALKRIAAPAGAATLLIHHAGKAADGKRTVDRIRGTSALSHASRCTYFFDEREEGSVVTCLKLSRSVKPAPFVLMRTVEADPENRTLWCTARLAVSTPQAAARTRAETFVLAQLEDEPVEMTSTAIRKAAEGTGLAAGDISKALESLTGLGRITFDDGPRGQSSGASRACRERLTGSRRPTLRPCRQPVRQGPTPHH